MSETPARIPPHILWPGMVVALLGLSVTMVTITVVAATTDPSFAVEADYDRRAQDWDAHKALLLRSERLGWATDITLDGPDALRRRSLTVRITDAEGRPVADAAIEAEVFHHAAASSVETLTLEAAGTPGTYAAPSRIDRPGIWEVRLRVEARGETFIHRRRLDLLSL